MSFVRRGVCVVRIFGVCLEFFCLFGFACARPRLPPLSPPAPFPPPPGRKGGARFDLAVNDRPAWEIFVGVSRSSFPVIPVIPVAPPVIPAQAGIQ